MKTGVTVGIVAIVLGLAGCAPPETESNPPATVSGPPEAPTPEAATFVDRVWRVAESTGMSSGQLVVFLSEGTLVFASPQSTPALGRWSYDGEALTMIEEGIPYRVEILELNRSEFRIRSHNPGVPVETRFVDAASAPPAAAP